MSLSNRIDDHFLGMSKDDQDLERRIMEFNRDGYTKFKINEFMPQELMKKVTEDVFEVIEKHAVRRDMKIETTGNSPRYMSTVPQQFIEQESDIIPLLYNSESLKNYLSMIAEDGLKSCLKEEEYIIAKLEKSGDTHGWHWGDYPYTLIWIIDAPGIEKGGLLQCIPHTTWDKSNPRINWHIANHIIKSYFHLPGEVYFLKSDTTLHRVTPVEGDNITRIILNTCWASINDERGDFEHETLNAAFL